MNTTQPTPTTHKSGDPLDRAFAWLRSLGIMRDPGDRWLGGVCSGVAHRIGIDPVIVRIALIVLTVMGGIGIPAYLLGWLLLPDTAGEIKAESGIRHGDGVGIVLLIAASLSLASVFAFGEQGWRFGWLIPVGIIVWMVSRKHGHHHGRVHRQTSGANADTAVPPRPTWAGESSADATQDPTAPQSFWTQVGEGDPVGRDATQRQPVAPAPTPPNKPAKRKGRPSVGARGALVIIGLAIAAYGLGRVLDAPTGFPGTPDVLGRLLALTVIATGVIVAALRGRTSGFPGTVGVVLAASTAFTVASPAVNFDFDFGPMGDRIIQPTNAEGDQRYEGGMGNLTLDLSKLSTEPTSAPTLMVDGGMGNTIVKIPAGLTVQLDANPGMGEVENSDGDNVPGKQLIGDGTADVIVRTDGGMGNVIIEEQK